jgi:signal peptidase I
VAAVEPDATVEDAAPGAFGGAGGGAGDGYGDDGSGGDLPRRSRRSRRRADRKIPAWLEALLYIAVTLLLTSLLKTFFIGMYSIPSESMEPYTYKGDRVVVDKLSMWVGGEPARGQVIVFHDPHHWLDGTETSGSGGNPVGAMLATVGLLPEQHDDLLIKRIIGVGGDTVECRSKAGPVYLNGRPLDESGYIQGGKNGFPCWNGVYKVVVPKDSLWVLGDNRQHSGDSAWNYVNRGLDNGYVPRANVVGHVIGVVSWLRNAPAPQPITPLPSSNPDTPAGPDITVGQG